MPLSEDEILPDADKKEVSKSSKGKKSQKSAEQKDNDCAISNSSDNTSNTDSSDTEYVCSTCSKRFSGFVSYKQHQKSRKHAKAVLKKKRAKKLLAKIAAGENNSDKDDEYLDFIQKPFAVCRICDKQFGGPESYEMHLTSKTHKQKVIQVSIIKKVKNNDEIDENLLKELYKNKQKPENQNADDLVEDAKEKISSLKEDFGEHEIFECKDCEKSFSGIIPYTQHVLSKVHAKAIEKKNLLKKAISEDGNHSGESSKRDISSLAEEDGILVCKMCTVTFSGPENALMHLKSRGHSKNLEKLIRKQQRKKRTSADVLHESNPSTEASQSSKQIATQPKALETCDAKTKNENSSETTSNSNDSSDDSGQKTTSKPCSSGDDSSENEQSKYHAKQIENKQKRIKELDENSKEQNEAATGIGSLPSSEKYNSYKKAMQSLLKESNI